MKIYRGGAVGKDVQGWITEALGGSKRYDVTSPSKWEPVKGGGRPAAIPVSIYDKKTQQSIYFEAITTPRSHITNKPNLSFIQGSGPTTERGFVEVTKEVDQSNKKSILSNFMDAHTTFSNRVQLSFDKRDKNNPNKPAQERFHGSLEGGISARVASGEHLSAGPTSPLVGTHESEAQSRSWSLGQLSVFSPNKDVYDNEIQPALNQLEKRLGLKEPLFYDAKHKSAITPSGMHMAPAPSGGYVSETAIGDKILKRLSLLNRDVAQGYEQETPGSPVTKLYPGEVQSDFSKPWVLSGAILPDEEEPRTGLHVGMSVPRDRLLGFPGSAIMDSRRLTEAGMPDYFGVPFTKNTSQDLDLSEEFLLENIDTMNFPDPRGDDVSKTYNPGDFVPLITRTVGEGDEAKEEVLYGITVQKRPWTISEKMTLSLALDSSEKLKSKVADRTDFNVIDRGVTTGKGNQNALVLGGNYLTNVGFKDVFKAGIQAQNYSAADPRQVGAGGTPVDIIGDPKSNELTASKALGGLSPSLQRSLLRETMEEVGVSEQTIADTLNVGFKEVGFDTGRAAAVYRGGTTVQGGTGTTDDGRSLLGDVWEHMWNQGKDPEFQQVYGISVDKDRNLGHYSEDQYKLMLRSEATAAELFLQDNPNATAEDVERYRNEAREWTRVPGPNEDAEATWRLTQKGDFLTFGAVINPTAEMAGDADATYDMRQALHQGGYFQFAEKHGIGLSLDMTKEDLAELPTSDRAWYNLMGGSQGWATGTSRPNSSTEIDTLQAIQMGQIAQGALEADPDNILGAIQEVGEYWANETGTDDGDFTSINLGSNNFLPDPRAVKAVSKYVGDKDITYQSQRFLDVLISGAKAKSLGGTEQEISDAMQGPLQKYDDGFKRQFHSKGNVVRSLTANKVDAGMFGRYALNTMLKSNEAYISDERMHTLFREQAGAKSNKNLLFENARFNKFKRDVASEKKILGGYLQRDPNVRSGSPETPAGLPVRLVTSDILRKRYPLFFNDPNSAKREAAQGTLEEIAAKYGNDDFNPRSNPQRRKLLAAAGVDTKSTSKKAIATLLQDENLSDEGRTALESMQTLSSSKVRTDSRMLQRTWDKFDMSVGMGFALKEQGDFDLDPFRLIAEVMKPGNMSKLAQDMRKYEDYDEFQGLLGRVTESRFDDATTEEKRDWVMGDPIAEVVLDQLQVAHDRAGGEVVSPATKRQSGVMTRSELEQSFNTERTRQEARSSTFNTFTRSMRNVMELQPGDMSPEKVMELADMAEMQYQYPLDLKRDPTKLEKLTTNPFFVFDDEKQGPKLMWYGNDNKGRKINSPMEYAQEIRNAVLHTEMMKDDYAAALLSDPTVEGNQAAIQSVLETARTEAIEKYGPDATRDEIANYQEARLVNANLQTSNSRAQQVGTAHAAASFLKTPRKLASDDTWGGVKLGDLANDSNTRALMAMETMTRKNDYGNPIPEGIALGMLDPKFASAGLLAQSLHKRGYSHIVDAVTGKSTGSRGLSAQDIINEMGGQSGPSAVNTKVHASAMAADPESRKKFAALNVVEKEFGWEDTTSSRQGQLWETYLRATPQFEGLEDERPSSVTRGGYTVSGREDAPLIPGDRNETGEDIMGEFKFSMNPKTTKSATRQMRVYNTIRGFGISDKFQPVSQGLVVQPDSKSERNMIKAWDLKIQSAGSAEERDAVIEEMKAAAALDTKNRGTIQDIPEYSPEEFDALAAETARSVDEGRAAGALAVANLSDTWDGKLVPKPAPKVRSRRTGVHERRPVNAGSEYADQTVDRDTAPLSRTDARDRFAQNYIPGDDPGPFLSPQGVTNYLTSIGEFDTGPGPGGTAGPGTDTPSPGPVYGDNWDKGGRNPLPVDRSGKPLPPGGYKSPRAATGGGGASPSDPPSDPPSSGGGKKQQLMLPEGTVKPDRGVIELGPGATLRKASVRGSVAPGGMYDSGYGPWGEVGGADIPVSQPESTGEMVPDAPNTLPERLNIIEPYLDVPVEKTPVQSVVGRPLQQKVVPTKHQLDRTSIGIAAKIAGNIPMAPGDPGSGGDGRHWTKRFVGPDEAADSYLQARTQLGVIQRELPKVLQMVSEDPTLSGLLGEGTDYEKLQNLAEGSMGLNDREFGRLTQVVGRAPGRALIAASNKYRSLMGKGGHELLNKILGGDDDAVSSEILGMPTAEDLSGAGALGGIIGGALGKSQSWGEAVQNKSLELDKAQDKLVKATEALAEARGSVSEKEMDLGARLAKAQHRRIGHEEDLAKMVEALDLSGGAMDDKESSIAKRRISDKAAQIEDDKRAEGSLGEALRKEAGMPPIMKHANKLVQNMFSGFGLMYMARIGSMVGGQAERGDAEWLQYEEQSREAGQRISGFSKQYFSAEERRTAMLRKAGSGAMPAITEMLQESGAGGSFGGMLMGAGMGAAAGFSAAGQLLGVTGPVGLTAAAVIGGSAMVGANVFGHQQDPASAIAKSAMYGDDTAMDRINRWWSSVGVAGADPDKLSDALAPGVSLVSSQADQIVQDPSGWGTLDKDGNFVGQGGGYKKSGPSKVINAQEAVSTSVDLYERASQAVMQGDTDFLMERLSYDTATDDQWLKLNEVLGNEFASLGDLAPVAAAYMSEGTKTGKPLDPGDLKHLLTVAGEEGIAGAAQFRASQRLGITSGVDAAVGMYRDIDTDEDALKLTAALQAGIPSSVRGQWGYGDDADSEAALGKELVKYTEFQGDRFGEAATVSEAATRFGGTTYDAAKLRAARYEQRGEWSPTQAYEHAQFTLGGSAAASAQQGLIAGGSSLQTVAAAGSLGAGNWGGLAAAQQLANLAPQRAMYGLENEYESFTANTVSLAQSQLSMSQQLVGRDVNAQRAGQIAQTATSTRQANYMSGAIAFQAPSMAIAQSHGFDPVQQYGIGSGTGATFAEMQTMSFSPGNVSGNIGLSPIMTNTPSSAEMAELQPYLDAVGNKGGAALEAFKAGGSSGLRAESAKHAMAQAGIQAASARLSFAFTTGVGLDAYQTRDPRSGKKFDIPQGGAWGLQEAQMELGWKQQDWSFDYQTQSQDMQQSQFYENQGLQRQQQLQQRQWTVEDYGYQDQTRALQWGWKQEDFQENNRFLTGRQRKISERQMGRDTVMHNLESEQIDTTRERNEEVWNMEDKKHQMTMEHYQEQQALQVANLDKMKEFYGESKTLQIASFELQKAQFIEQNKLAMAAASTFAAEAKNVADAIALMREEREATAKAAGTGEFDDPALETGVGGNFGGHGMDRGIVAMGRDGDRGEVVTVTSEGDKEASTDAWNQVISAVAQVADNTAQPQIINLSVQLPGGEFKTFVFDIVTRELVGIGGDSSNTSATISIPKDTRTRSKYSRE